MIGKIFASLILLGVLYIFGIFFAPNLADNIAERMGVLSINTTIREFKNGIDSTSNTLLQIKDASGTLSGVRGIVDQANEKIHQTTEAINTIRQVSEQKVEQVQQTADAIKKAGEAISEVQNNLTNLTSLSGSARASEKTSGTGTQK